MSDVTCKPLPQDERPLKEAERRQWHFRFQFFEEGWQNPLWPERPRKGMCSFLNTGVTTLRVVITIKTLLTGILDQMAEAKPGLTVWWVKETFVSS